MALVQNVKTGLLLGNVRKTHIGPARTVLHHAGSANKSTTVRNPYIKSSYYVQDLKYCKGAIISYVSL